MSINKKCTKGYTLQALQSNAGYYIGTFDPNEGPICRLSEEYYKTKEIALDALKTNTFTQRSAPENMFCCGSNKKYI